MVRTAAEGGSLFLTEKPADTGDPIAATRRMSHLRDKVESIEDLTANGAEMIFVDQMTPLIAEMDSRRLIDAERGFHVDQLAYIIYTFGSNGRPKGVAVDHPSICNFVRVAAEVYGIRPRDRVYQGLTIAFDFSAMVDTSDLIESSTTQGGYVSPATGTEEIFTEVLADTYGGR